MWCVQGGVELELLNFPRECYTLCTTCDFQKMLLWDLCWNTWKILSLALGLNMCRCLNSWYFYHFLSTSSHGILRISSYCNHQTMYEVNCTEESCIIEEFQFWMSRFALIWKKTVSGWLLWIEISKKKLIQMKFIYMRSLLAIYRYRQPL